MLFWWYYHSQIFILCDFHLLFRSSIPCFKLTCCLWNHRVLICNARLCHGQHGWVCVNDPVWSYSLKASLKWCFQLQPLNCMFFCNTKLETWVGYMLDVVVWMNTQWYPPRQNLRWITKSWVNYKILDVFFDEYPTNTQWNPWLSHLFVLSFPNSISSGPTCVMSTANLLGGCIPEIWSQNRWGVGYQNGCFRFQTKKEDKQFSNVEPTNMDNLNGNQWFQRCLSSFLIGEDLLILDIRLKLGNHHLLSLNLTVPA